VFKEMHSFDINFVRLPLGYWNVIDMPETPIAPSPDNERMANLAKIMPAVKY
jgi:aryl-phospho-beta-D-glucosidase BglC (GH1 family)